MKKHLFLAALFILSASITTAYAGFFSLGMGGLGDSGFGTSHVAGNLNADTSRTNNDDVALSGAIDVDTNTMAPNASSQTEANAKTKTQVQLKK